MKQIYVDIKINFNTEFVIYRLHGQHTYIYYNFVRIIDYVLPKNCLLTCSVINNASIVHHTYTKRGKIIQR